MLVGKSLSQKIVFNSQAPDVSEFAHQGITALTALCEVLGQNDEKISPLFKLIILRRYSS